MVLLSIQQYYNWKNAKEIRQQEQKALIDEESEVILLETDEEDLEDFLF